MPAVWTTPVTWESGDEVEAADLNEQVRDNLEYLKANADSGGIVPFLLMGA